MYSYIYSSGVSGYLGGWLEPGTAKRRCGALCWRESSLSLYIHIARVYQTGWWFRCEVSK